MLFRSADGVQRVGSDRIVLGYRREDAFQMLDRERSLALELPDVPEIQIHPDREVLATEREELGPGP